MQSLPENIPAYILCGGLSQRFGSDKARTLVDGQPQLLHLAGSLRAVGHDVFYVADRAERYRDLGITCLVDEQSQCGPLAGLGSALQHRAAQPTMSDGCTRAAGWLLLVNCDQALWDAGWFEQLWVAATANLSTKVAAYHDTAWQPLPALVHVGLLDEVAIRLQAGRLSLQQLLSDMESIGWCARVTADLSPNAWSFNTPEELVKLSKR